MERDELRALQAPLKQQYRDNPESAQITLRAEGSLTEGIACSVATGRALVEAGLHPATGGTGLNACSGDMLLQALAACAGVTLILLEKSPSRAFCDQIGSRNAHNTLIIEQIHAIIWVHVTAICSSPAARLRSGRRQSSSYPSSPGRHALPPRLPRPARRPIRVG